MGIKKIRWRERQLQFDNGKGWTHYSLHPNKVADYPIPKGSKGFATMQKLLALGYTYEVILRFDCPGCGQVHEVYPAPHAHPQTGRSWQWNGSFDSPTFSPGFHFQIGDDKSLYCESHIEEGEIHFLGDSAHKLAGDSVSLRLL